MALVSRYLVRGHLEGLSVPWDELVILQVQFFSLAPLSYVSFVAQTRHETIVRYTISTLVVFLIVFVNFANRVRHRLVRVSQAQPISHLDGCHPPISSQQI